jgi:hypothetical protein
MEDHAPVRAGVTGGRGHGTGTVAGVTSLRSMSWHWRLEDSAGAAIDPTSVGVEVVESENQGDAESWLGENWRELLHQGVATVTLFDGENEVYGPMGLAAP